MLDKSNAVTFRSPPSKRTEKIFNFLSRRGAAKLYTAKTPITATDLLNHRVLPFFAGQSTGVIRITTDRGTEYCGKPEHHDYQTMVLV